MTEDIVTEHDLRATSGFIVQSLVDHGFSRIGAFDLNGYIHDLAKVHYSIVPDAQFAQGRRYLRYDVPTQTVFIPKKDLGLGATESPYILLHESLGALGYIDDNYQMSTLIFLLSSEFVSGSNYSLAKTMKDIAFTQTFNQPKRKTNPKAIENNILIAEGGGTTGAGGGGDPHAALVKFQALFLMAKLQKQFQLSDEQFSDQLIWINQHVGVETYTIKPNDHSVKTCPLLIGFDAIDAELLIGDADGLSKIYYPASCSENFAKEHTIPQMLLPSRILAKMIHLYWLKHGP